MRRAIFCAILLSSPAWTGPLRFSPDTVCQRSYATCPSTTTVKNISKDSVSIQLLNELSPLSSPNELAFNWSVPTGVSFKFFQFDSARSTKVGYLLKGRNLTGLTNLGGLKSGASAILSTFEVGTCLGCSAIQTAQASTTGHLGNGDVVGLVFTSSPGGADTLYLKVDYWTQGGGIRQAYGGAPPSHLQKFSADGKSTSPLSNAIRVGSEGAHVNLR